jgi:hypothetical protein
MHWLLTAALALALFACNTHQAGEDRVAAADLFTQAYERQELEAFVGGADCLALIIRANTRLDDSVVESMQYGTGPYVAFGGVEVFAEKRRFRAVVYRDAADGLWTYGAVSRDEARSMPRCS